MTSHGRFASILFVIFIGCPAVSQADKIDDFIKTEMKRQNIPGLSIAVVKDGKVIKAQGYGLANAKLKTPATAETVYQIASVSKQFIAAGIMLLVQEGKISLDDPVSKYLGMTPSTWNEISIRHALTHTSGLVREAPGFHPFKVQDDADVIKTAYPLPLRFPPGEKWEYGNLGYFVLAEVISRVTGQPWTEYLDSKIFKPSGMINTYPVNAKVSIPNRAQGYVDNDKLQEAQQWLASRPSGAFLSTVLDMAKWDTTLMSGKILTDATQRQMWTPVKLNDGTSYGYGFGWFFSKNPKRRFVHHSGGMPGFRAKFARFMDDHLTIIILMNLDDVDIDSIFYGLANLYF